MSVCVHMYVCVCMCVHMCVIVAQLCLTLCDPMDCSWPGSSVHGIIPARILEQVAISFSQGSSYQGIELVSCIASRFFIAEPQKKVILSNQGPTPRSHLVVITRLETASPRTDTLQIRASIREFWGKCKHSVPNSHCPDKPETEGHSQSGVKHLT